MNETINQTLTNSNNSTIDVIHQAINQTPGAEVWQKTLDLIVAPYNYPELLWIVFPMIVGLVLMEIYFGRYKEEALGWNTAVGNSLILIFVSIDLFKKIYGWESTPIEVVKNIGSVILKSSMGSEQFIITLIAFAVMLWGFVLMFVDFFHLLPEKLAFALSSGLTINVFAYVAIVVVYSSVGGSSEYLSWVTLLASFVLFIILHIVFGIIHFFEPQKYSGFFKKYGKE